jgi:hypothetical protein
MANRFPLIFNSGAGQIQELAASDNLDLTSSNLVNAGILFTSSGSQTAPSLQIGSGTTYNPGLYSPGTDQLAISTSGTGWVFVDASGNVGVGTASPAAKLDVNGKTIVSNEGANPLNLYKYGTASPSILMYGANGTAASPTQTLTGDVIAGLNAFGRGSSDWAGGPSVRITAIATENNGGTSNRGADIKFETVATGGTSLQERLRLTSAGLLGLGVSAPQAKLHISDLTASALELMRLQVNLTSPSGNKSITWADSTDVVGRISVDYTSPTVKMRFGSLYNSGYQTSDLMTLTPTGLGIGSASPEQLLHLLKNQNGSTGFLVDNQWGTAGASASLTLKTADVAGSSTATFTIDKYKNGSAIIANNETNSAGNLSFNVGSSERARIDSSGRLLIGTVTTTGKLTLVSDIDPGTTAAGIAVSLSGIGGGTATAQYGIRVTGTGYNNSTNVYGVHSALTQQLTSPTYGGYFSAISLYAQGYGVYAETTCTNPVTGGTSYAGYFKANSSAAGTNYNNIGLRIENAATTGSLSRGLYVSTVSGPTTVIPFQVDHAGTERARIDSSGRLLVGTASAGAGTADATSIVGSSLNQSTGLRSLSSGGTLDLNLLGTGIVGHLYVGSVYTANAATRTNTVFFITTRQGNATVITSLNSGNGSSGGRTFTITNPSANIFRFTDTSSSACTVSMSFVGSITF